MVASVEYDPNRSAHIALLHYRDGEKRYILAPVGIGVGSEISSGPGVEPRPGNAMQLARVPAGAEVHAVELTPGRGAQLVRSAGMVCQLMAKDRGLATLRFAVGRDASGIRCLHGHHWTCRKRGPQQPIGWEGRSDTLAGPTTTSARCGYERCRPSARWRRR